MPITNTLIRLGARRNFDKTDVETVYGEIVRVVGGTRFVNGVPTGPTNGLLDHRNFAPDLGITNSYKNNAFSYFAATCDFGNTVTGPGFFMASVSFPWETIGLSPNVNQIQTQMIGFNCVVRDPSAAINAGQIQPTVWRRGSQIFPFAAQAWTNVPLTRATLTTNIAVGSFTQDIQPRDIVQMLIQTTTAGVSYGHIVSTVWFKALHVR